MSSNDPSRIVLNLKLKPEARLDEVLSGLEGILETSRLFPDETDPDLSCLFRLEVKSSDSKSIRESLTACPFVEYIEEPPRRRLIRAKKPGSMD